MRIEDSNGTEIVDLEQWSRLYDTPRERRKWKEHRSAYSVAEFILNHAGGMHLQARVCDVLGESVTFERAVPEYEQRFDEFGKGRVHDLAIFGTTLTGQSVFVGLEGKVDEPFGEPVNEIYLKAKAKQIAGKPTNAPERIERLLALHFSKPDVLMIDVRYQLLYATVGTLAVEADISVLYVMVFRTSLYNEKIGADNYRDYINFMAAVGGQRLNLEDDGAIAHEITLEGKRLVCLHEYFEL